MITPLTQFYSSNSITQINSSKNYIHFTGRTPKISREDAEIASGLYNSCKSYIIDLLPAIKEKTEHIKQLKKIFNQKPDTRPYYHYTTECTYENISHITYNGGNYTVKKSPDGKKIMQIGEKLKDENLRYYYVFSGKKNNTLKSIHEYTGLNETLNASLVNGKVVSIKSKLKDLPAEYTIKLDYKGNIKDISTQGLFSDKKYIFDTKGRLISITKTN